MKYAFSIALLAAATATALADPTPAQHPRVGQLAKVRFATGSADIVFDPSGKVAAKLNEAAAWADQHPDGLIVLDGHADPPGTAAFNARLSLERAKAVRERLITAGVNPDQIVLAAFGEAGPAHVRSVVVWGTQDGTRPPVARTLGPADAATWKQQVLAR